VLGGGLVPASLVLVGGEPGVGDRHCPTALGSIGADGPRCDHGRRVHRSAQGRPAGSARYRDPRRDRARRRLRALRPSGRVCVVDSVQTSKRIGSAQLGRAGAEAASPCCRSPRSGSRSSRRHVTKTARRRPARARAPGRYRPAVRGGAAKHRVLRAAKNRFGSTNELAVSR
jgi:hypothetical protein